MALPVAIADERDIAVAGGDVDIGGGAAEDGLDAEDGEGVGGDVVAAYLLRRAVAGNGDGAGTGGGGAGEDVRVARYVQILRGRVDAPGAARLIGRADGWRRECTLRRDTGTDR